MADRAKTERGFYGGPTATGQMVDKGLGFIMNAIPGVGKILGPLYGILSGSFQLVSDKIEQNKMDKMGGQSYTKVDVGELNPLAGRSVNQGTDISTTDVVVDPVHVGNTGAAMASFGQGLFSSLFNRGGNPDGTTLAQDLSKGVGSIFSRDNKVPIKSEMISPFSSVAAKEEVLANNSFSPYLNTNLSQLWSETQSQQPNPNLNSPLNPDANSYSPYLNKSINDLWNNQNGNTILNKTQANTPASNTQGVSIKGMQDEPIDVKMMFDNLKQLGIL
jgi:hypothetical protein